MLGFFNPFYYQIGEIIQKQANQLAYDRIDVLNAWFTPFVLIGLTLAISGKQYFGQPLKCWTPREFSGSWDGYVHDYCFIENTYFVPNGTEVTDIARGERRINYYRWVPLFMLMQAALFIVPYFMWNMMHKKTKIDLKGSLRLFKTHLKNMGAEKGCAAFAGELAKKLDGIHSSNGPLAKCQSTINYFLLKIGFVVNCVFQMVLLRYFLDVDDYFWGFFHFAKVEFKGTSEYEDSIFPRVVLCDFTIRTLGQQQQHTVSCIMMLNMIIEKVYIVFYFWLIFVAVVTLVSMVTFGIQILFRRHALIPTNLNKMHYMNPTKSQDFIRNFLGFDGVLLITYLDTQFGAYTTYQLIDCLVKKFLEEHSMNSSAETSIHGESSPNRYVQLPYDEATMRIGERPQGIKQTSLDEVDGEGKEVMPTRVVESAPPLEEKKPLL